MGLEAATGREARGTGGWAQPGRFTLFPPSSGSICRPPPGCCVALRLTVGWGQWVSRALSWGGLGSQSIRRGAGAHLWSSVGRLRVCCGVVVEVSHVAVLGTVTEGLLSSGGEGVGQLGPSLPQHPLRVCLPMAETPRGWAGPSHSPGPQSWQRCALSRCPLSAVTFLNVTAHHHPLKSSAWRDISRLSEPWYLRVGGSTWSGAMTPSAVWLGQATEATPLSAALA